MSDWRFVTWEKNCDKKLLSALADELFKTKITVANRNYKLFEVPKTYKSAKGTSIELRRIISRNIKSGETFAIVTNDKDEAAETIAESMLKRWGCSENGLNILAHE